MGWVFNGIDTENTGREYKDRELLGRLLKALAPYKVPFTIIVVTVLAMTVVNLSTPLVLGWVLDGMEAGFAQDRLLFGAAAYLILYLLLFALYFVQNWGIAKLVPEFMIDLRMGVFDSLQRQDMKFYDKQRSGRLSSRVGADAAEVGNIVMILATFSGNFLLVFLSYGILFVISPELTAISLIVVPLVIGFTWGFRSIARKVSRRYRRSIASVNAAISESVEGIQIAKSYGREQETIENFMHVNEENYIAGRNQGLAMQLLMPTIDLFFVLGVWLVLQFGSGWSQAGMFGISATTLYVFVLYLNNSFFPLMQMSTFYSQLQAGFAAYERIAEVEDAVPEVDENAGGIVIKDFKGDIRFENVMFGYKPNEWVLDNFNLHIKSGERLAIVGHTGAGKTTLANILTRFYEYQGGQVLIDGQDLRSLDIKKYRRKLGIVQQEPFLFSGTVEDNIRYGRRKATREDVERAVQAVHADEFLQYMPEGLLTDVQERGSRLSTGQRQLVCFARALLANPRILILDEATSAVDAYTEAVIQEALEKLFEGRTSIVIAHRLSTVVNSDRIIVLDHGTIVEEGNHEELLQQGGKYKELYDIYFRHQAVGWRNGRSVAADVGVEQPVVPQLKSSD